MTGSHKFIGRRGTNLGVGLAILAGAMLGPLPHAQAGYWKTEYRITGDFDSDLQQFLDVLGYRRVQSKLYSGQGDIWTQTQVGAPYRDHLIELGWYQNRLQAVAQYRVIGPNYHGANMGHYSAAKVKPGTAKMDLKVQATIRWMRNEYWYDENGDYQESPDPTDNPPEFLLVREHGILDLSMGHSVPTWAPNAYTIASPYMGQYVTDIQMAHTLPNQTATETRVNPGMLARRIEGGIIRRLPVESDAVQVPAFKVDGFARVTPPPFEVHSEGVGADFGLEYYASPVSIELKSRRKGSGTAFTSISTVAAGGKNTDEHKAEIQMRVMDDVHWEGIPGVPWNQLPKLKFSNNSAQGVLTAASLLPAENPETAAVEFDTEARTDQYGKIIVGMVQSKDKIGSQGSLIVGLEPDKSNTWALTQVNNSWDLMNEWKTGEAGLSDLPSFVIEQDITLPMTFKPAYPENVKIKGHNITMKVGRVQVTDWRDADNPRTKIITTKPEEVNAEAIPPVVLGNPGLYAKFLEENVDDAGNGTYHGQLKVQPGDGYTVDRLWFKAVDNGVFLTVPATP